MLTLFFFADDATDFVTEKLMNCCVGVAVDCSVCACAPQYIPHMHAFACVYVLKCVIGVADRIVIFVKDVVSLFGAFAVFRSLHLYWQVAR